MYGCPADHDTESFKVNENCCGCGGGSLSEVEEVGLIEVDESVLNYHTYPPVEYTTVNACFDLDVFKLGSSRKVNSCHEYLEGHVIPYQCG